MRLIDSDDLVTKLEKLIKARRDWQIDSLAVQREIHGLDVAICEAVTAPTIKAVPVIRCKDCYFCGEIDENGWHCCENSGAGMPKDGFCSDAERKLLDLSM